MAAFDFKRDWPIAAAGAAAVGGVLLYTTGRRTEAFNQPVAVGASPEAYAAAVQAATQVELGRQQTTAQVTTAFLAAEAAREASASAERIEAARLATVETIAREQGEMELARLEGEFATRRAQSAAAQQSSLFGFLGNIATAIIPRLFSVERTADAELRRPRRSYRVNVLYQGTYTNLQTPTPGGPLGIPRTRRAAA